MGIESQEVAKGLDSDDRAEDGIPLWNRRLKKDLQGFPGASAQVGKKVPIIEKIPPQDLRNAKDEMPVRNFLEHVMMETGLGMMDGPALSGTYRIRVTIRFKVRRSERVVENTRSLFLSQREKFTLKKACFVSLDSYSVFSFLLTRGYRMSPNRKEILGLLKEKKG